MMLRKVVSLMAIIMVAGLVLAGCKNSDAVLKETSEAILPEAAETSDADNTSSKEEERTAVDEEDTETVADSNDTNETNDTNEKQDSGETKQEASDEEQELPDYIDVELTDMDGNTVNLSDYEGKFIALNFFGTWCKYCMEEMPVLEKVYSEYDGDDFVLLLVNATTTEQITKEEVIDWYDENEWSMPMVFDLDGSVMSTYPVTGFPTTYFINKEGKVLGAIPGALTEEILTGILGEYNK